MESKSTNAVAISTGDLPNSLMEENENIGTVEKRRGTLVDTLLWIRNPISLIFKSSLTQYVDGEVHDVLVYNGQYDLLRHRRGPHRNLRRE